MIGATDKKDIETDALLAEYLRVINEKDGHVHDLVAANQKLDCDLRKKDEKYKTKSKELKAEIERMTSKLEQQVAEQQKLLEENKALAQKNRVLDGALQKLQAELRTVATATEQSRREDDKARLATEQQLREERSTLNAKLGAAVEQARALQGQLQVCQQRLAESEKEASHWKVETQHMQRQFWRS